MRSISVIIGIGKSAKCKVQSAKKSNNEKMTDGQKAFPPFYSFDLKNSLRTLHFALITFLVGTNIVIPKAFAQITPSAVDACRTAIANALGSQDRLYRRNLYGLPRAADVESGNVRYDIKGYAWQKMGKNLWRSQAPEVANVVWTDALMDTWVERDSLNTSDAATFRKGIFATRGVLTSELIPPLMQNFRALHCRTESVCQAVDRSLSGEKTDSGLYTTKVKGCRDIPISVITACLPKGEQSVAANQTVARTSCPEMATQLLAREASLLRLGVTYDASYRSLLQFAGTFDDFLSVFRVDLVRPLRQSMPLLQQLSRIPCFLSQCNG